MTVPGGGQYDDFILVLLLPPFRCSLQMEKPAGEGKREREPELRVDRRAR